MKASCRPRPDVVATELVALISDSREFRRAVSCALHVEILLAEAANDRGRIDTLLQAVSSVAQLNRIAAATAEEAPR